MGLRNRMHIATTAATASTVQPTGPEKNASRPGSRVPVRNASSPLNAALIAVIAGPSTAAQPAMVAPICKPARTPAMEITAEMAGANTTKAAASATAPPTMAWSGPGIEAKALAAASTALATPFSSGINAVPMPTPRINSLPSSSANLSLRPSAPLANGPVIVAAKSSMLLRPPFSIGIMSAPALPNSAIASSAFLPPSSMFLNLSATSSIT